MFIASRLTNVYFLTNKDSTSVAPNTNGNGGWITCYYSETAKGDWYTVTCDTNYQTPLTRQFGIAATGVQAIELREVQIHGYGKYILIKFISLVQTTSYLANSIIKVNNNRDFLIVNKL